MSSETTSIYSTATQLGIAYTPIEQLQSLVENTCCLVDPERHHYLNETQVETALHLICQKLLEEIPNLPSNNWYKNVFNNFDIDKDGLIHKQDLLDIVRQYHEHHIGKKVTKILHNQQNQLSSHPRMLSGDRSVTSLATSHHTTGRNGSMVSMNITEKPSQQQQQTNNETIDPIKNIDDQQSSNGHASVRSKHAIRLKDDFLFPQNHKRLAIFDDYEFFDKAGEGSFGKVLIIRHKKSKKVRACKAIAIHSNLQLELISLEISLLKNLDHPNILRLYESYHDGSNMYIVMQLCEGGALFDRIVHHYEKLKVPMTEVQVSTYMTQMLSAVSYCHSHGIIHRDLKPENVLFVTTAADSPLKIIDFGLSSTVDRVLKTRRDVKKDSISGFNSTSNLSFFSKISNIFSCGKPVTKRIMQRAGTPHYMSPEMLVGEYDEQTDCFSLGVILYQLLCGLHPFFNHHVDDENSIRQKIMKMQVTFPQKYWCGVSSDAIHLCRSLLNKNPKKRITSTNALHHRWFKDPFYRHNDGNTKHPVHPHNNLLTQSVFNGLKEYSQFSRLKQCVLQLLSRELSEFQIQDLRIKFNAIDVHRNGYITVDELKLAMAHYGLQIPEGEVKLIIESIGQTRKDGSFVIGYNEFITALSERKISENREVLYEIFKKLDVDNVGRITMSGLKKVILSGGAHGNSILSQYHSGVTDSELYEIFADYSADGLSFDDFCIAITGHRYATQ